MLDPKDRSHGFQCSGSHSELLGQWENEGGSTCWTDKADYFGEIHCRPHLEAETTLLDLLPMGIMITNLAGDITYCNPACENIHDVSPLELVGTCWYETIDARDRPVIPFDLSEKSTDRQAPAYEVRSTNRRGAPIWTRRTIARLSPDLGPGYIHTIEDLSKIRLSEQAAQVARQALSREQERARVTLECIGDAVISTDARGQVAYLNAVAEDLTGWSREAAVGQPFSCVFKVVDSRTGELARNPAERAMESLSTVEMPANCLLQRPDGSELAIEDSAAPIRDADGRLAGAVVVFRDRNMSRKSTTRMAFLARHDVLTGLPNRVAFSERCDQAIELAKRHNNVVGLLFIDLRNFKQVNDSLGHKAGDRLLRYIARGLTACVRRTDMVCRHGGDEFVVLLSEISRADDAGRLATKMRRAAARPMYIHGYPITLDLSIGISLYPDHGGNTETLLRRADTAMYMAKRTSGIDYCFYQEDLKRRIVIPQVIIADQ